MTDTQLNKELNDIRLALGRISSHLESERRQHSEMHRMIDKLHDMLYGNGKAGLKNDVQGLMESQRSWKGYRASVVIALTMLLIDRIWSLLK